jgi:hypothetical protein
LRPARRSAEFTTIFFRYCEQTAPIRRREAQQ